MTSGDSGWVGGGSVPLPSGFGRHSAPESLDHTDSFGMDEPHSRPAGHDDLDPYRQAGPGRHSTRDAAAGDWNGDGGWHQQNGGNRWPEPYGQASPYGPAESAGAAGPYGPPVPYGVAGSYGTEPYGGAGSYRMPGTHPSQDPYGEGPDSYRAYGQPGYGDPAAVGSSYGPADPYRAGGVTSRYDAGPYAGGPPDAAPFHAGTYGGGAYGGPDPAADGSYGGTAGRAGYDDGAGYLVQDRYGDPGQYRPGDWNGASTYGPTGGYDPSGPAVGADYPPGAYGQDGAPGTYPYGGPGGYDAPGPAAGAGPYQDAPGWGGGYGPAGPPGPFGRPGPNNRAAPRELEAGTAPQPYLAAGDFGVGGQAGIIDAGPEHYPSAMAGETGRYDQAGQYSGDGGYGPADGRYGPADGRYGPADGRYAPADGRYAAADGGYPPADGRYDQATVNWVGDHSDDVESDADTSQYARPPGGFGSLPGRGGPGYEGTGYPGDHDYPGAYREMDASEGGPYRPGEVDDDPFGPAAFGRPGRRAGGDLDDGGYGEYGDHGEYPDTADGYGHWQDDAGADHWDDHGDDDQWQEEPDSGLLAGISAGGGRRRARRQRRLRGKAALIVSILVVALVLGVAASFGYERVHKFLLDRYGNYPGPGTGTVEVTVPQGASLISLAPLLVKNGVIMATHPFISAANSVSNAASLQPGVYKLRHHMNATLAVKLLLSGNARVSNQVTIVEGVRASAIAALLAKRTGRPASEFLAIINHPPASLGLPPYAHGRTEGYLFPDTYTLLPKQTPLEILRAMVTEFKQKAASIGLLREAARVNLSPGEVVIIASLVQAEGNGTDFGQISRVIDNRLNRHMLLEFDSTVFYAMGKYGTSVTRAQEKYPSPYNTYLHTGLPPGAIGNPGLAALQATLHPPHGPWLYFITVNLKTGKTLFTDSLAQLQQWQRQYQG